MKVLGGRQSVLGEKSEGDWDFEHRYLVTSFIQLAYLIFCSHDMYFLDCRLFASQSDAHNSCDMQTHLFEQIGHSRYEYIAKHLT